MSAMPFQTHVAATGNTLSPCSSWFNSITLAQGSQISYTIIQRVDAQLANRPFLVIDFRALWRSTLSARVHDSQKLKMVG